MLPLANAARRETLPASELVLALQCGGSTAIRITANPRLVPQPTSSSSMAAPRSFPKRRKSMVRNTSDPPRDKPRGRREAHQTIKWWEDYNRRNGGEMNNNPSPGNKAGGLTTILREVAGCGGEGWDDRADRGLINMQSPLRPRVSCSWIRRAMTGFGNRAGCRRRQPAVLHHGAGGPLWLQADAVDQAFYQFGDLPAMVRGHGHQLRRYP